MLSSIRKIFLTLIIITAILFIGIYAYSRNRTYLNDENEIGNTAGNIYNGGLFSEQDDTIFFSNPNTDGSLSVMTSNGTNVRQISNDKAIYINADGNYLYYCKANNTKRNQQKSILGFNNSGIYRIKQNGTELKSISNKPGAYLTLKGNSLYYQSYDVDSGLFLYRNKIDSTQERLLVKEAVIPAKVNRNSLYFAGTQNDHNIHLLNLQSYTNKNYILGNYLYPIYFDEYIYYIDPMNDYKIYRMNQNGTDPTLLVDERCSTYNITNSGKYLYYQIDNGKKSRISSMNLETRKSITLLEGNYKQINVTNDFVYFRDFKETKTYMTAAEGGTKISTFNPQIMKKK